MPDSLVTVLKGRPETVRELAWLHSDLRMLGVPEDAALTWVDGGVRVVLYVTEAEPSDAQPGS